MGFIDLWTMEDHKLFQAKVFHQQASFTHKTKPFN